MRKLLVLFLIALPILCNAQLLRFTGTAVAFRQLYNNTWEEWPQWEATNVLIVVDIDNDVINIYSKREQQYDIIEYVEERTASNSIILKCVDEENIKCTVELFREEDNMRIYIRWSNLQYAYQLEKK